MARRRQGATAVAQQLEEPAAAPPPAAVVVAFECDRAALVAALRRVKRAINAKTTMPILALAHVEVTHESARITGTDLTIAITEDLPVACERSGVFLLPMSLLDLLSTSDAERVTVRVDASCVVRATFGRRSGEYASAIAEDYPSLPKCATWTTIEGRVLDLLAQVGHCQSSDQTRPQFMATLFEFSGGTLTVVATDGQRMGFRAIPHEGQGSILLPQEFTEALELLDEAVSFELGRLGSSVFVRQGSTQIVGKLVDQVYPAWGHVASDARSPVVAECDRAALLSALRGMTSVDDKHSTRVALAFNEHEIEVTARDSSGSRSARAAIAAALTGKPFRGGINAQYLIAALSTSKAERVRIEAVVERDWSSTLLVLDENGGEVVMGMRP